MPEATCQCKAIRIPLPELPNNQTRPQLYHCHCTQCRAQSSSAFGTSAIYPDFQLPVESAPLGVWTRPTSDPARVMDCYFCTKCGVRIVHRGRDVGEAREEAGMSERYQAAEGREISVKGGCIEGLDWSGGVHIHCATAVTNLAFPDEVVKFVNDDDGERWDRKTVQR